MNCRWSPVQVWASRRWPCESSSLTVPSVRSLSQYGWLSPKFQKRDSTAISFTAKRPSKFGSHPRTRVFFGDSRACRSRPTCFGFFERGLPRVEWQRSSSFQAAQGGGKPPHSTMAGGLVATVLVPPLSFGDLGDGGQQGLG